MESVTRFWSHEAQNIRCVHEAEYDRVTAENTALQQRLTVADQRVDELETALKFYADREHYHFESGNWDTVSGEPLNILWCGDEPDFIEDGSVARAALSASTEPVKGDDWRMNPCKQGHRDVGAAGGVAHCYTCDEKITAVTTQEAFEQWNATHPASAEPAPVCCGSCPGGCVIQAAEGEVETGAKVSTCNQIREESGLPPSSPCVACNNGACIDR